MTKHPPSPGLAITTVVPELVLIAPILSPLYQANLPNGFWIFWFGVIQAVFISRILPSTPENVKRLPYIYIFSYNLFI